MVFEPVKLLPELNLKNVLVDDCPDVPIDVVDPLQLIVPTERFAFGIPVFRSTEFPVDGDSQLLVSLTLI